MDILRKKVRINIWFLIQQMKIKNYLKNIMMFLMEFEIKSEINDECDYEKDYMKIKFNSDDDLPLNKSLKFTLMTITIRCVFE